MNILLIIALIGVDFIFMAWTLYKIVDWQDTRVYASEKYDNSQEYWIDTKFKLIFTGLMICWIAVGIAIGVAITMI